MSKKGKEQTFYLMFTCHKKVVRNKLTYLASGQLAVAK